MGHIIGISAGEIADKETYAIDEHIVDVANEESPVATFVPTASGEAEGYVDVFKSIYGDELGCQTETLRIFDSDFTKADAVDLLDRSDIVYAGGGDTRFMLNAWRTAGLVDLLEDAYRDGTVMTGLCCGLMCWFAGGYDLANDPNVPYVPVSGLGWYDQFLATPHADDEQWWDAFDAFYESRERPALALDANCAIELVDNRYRLLRSDPDAGGRIVYHEDGERRVEEIPIHDEFRSLETLRQ